MCLVGACTGVRAGLPHQGGNGKGANIMRFSNDSDAKGDIMKSLEGQEGKWDADAIDAIFREAYEWRIDTNEEGQQLLNSAGFEQVVSADEFWEIVARHDQSAA